ncbi:MAG: DUF4837 family protein [Bacteroidales bacterium]|nr:DUF4837 family protein [Bacteroidales bacterium]
MMKRIKNIPFIFITFLVLSSCNSEERIIANSTGKSSEMLVVIEKQHWNGAVGNEIKAFFGQDMEGLPQPEALFNFYTIPEADFSSIFQVHRNIFIASIRPEHTQPYIETKRDLWAKPQRVIKINAASDSAFLRLFHEHKNSFLKLYDQAERERIQKAYSSVTEHTIKNEMVENFGFSLTVPSGFYIAKKSQDFMWIRRETLEFSQALLIYTYDYKDTADFKQRPVLGTRDFFTKQHVPGTFEGTYMSVAGDFIVPVSQRIDFNGRFAVETRGLWEIKGDFMGGPFINYTLVNEAGNKIVALDAYVYAPNERKRDLVRQLEAIIYTYEPAKN